MIRLHNAARHASNTILCRLIIMDYQNLLKPLSIGMGCKEGWKEIYIRNVSKLKDEIGLHEQFGYHGIV
jgi:hypothetical protein